jgi:predicted GH43/DUF377 family glycosyl hydrolase
MFVVRRTKENPLLEPIPDDVYESHATFNPSPVKVGPLTYILYRAMSTPEPVDNTHFSYSRIMSARSMTGLNFTGRKPFIEPEEIWERYGCEDPRVTYINKKYYIFYTALSTFPFGPEGIKVAVAISPDMKTLESKHLVTPFNAKAMTLFPEKINGKLTAMLIVHSDQPPSKTAIVQFDKEEDMWSGEFWENWIKNIDSHAFNFKRKADDRIEIGATPIKTKDGWLMVYSHIQNYYTHDQKIFGVEVALLDLKDPRKIIGRTKGPILLPEEKYEHEGIEKNIIFPSGALIVKDNLRIYYGGADTVCAAAEVNLELLLRSMTDGTEGYIQRSTQNPLLMPTKFAWEKRAVFNPAAIDLNKQIHILYRAMSEDNTTTIGYAASKNGERIDLRLDKPIYVPREGFEEKRVPNENSGCEDARVTHINNRIYMCYTAYNGVEVPAVALTSINDRDFIHHIWKWSKPILISPVGIDDKDACIVPHIKNKKHLFIHRINNHIVASYIDIDKPERVKEYSTVLGPRPGMWDSKKVGITVPPIYTKKGWLLPYHAVSNEGFYRVGLALLDLKDPTKVISRTSTFIFEPEEQYEKVGQIPNVVFPCGSIVRGDKLFLYYGGADSVVGLATASISELLEILLS